jgi:hypothetical protein
MSAAPQASIQVSDPPIAEWAVPTRWSSAVFRAKVAVHRIRRRLRDLAAGPRLLSRSDDAGYSLVLGESRTRLWSDERLAERVYQLGKVHNLRRAVAALDRVAVPAAGVFSFWKQIGRASRRRGYVVGRMLQQGCLVPAVGGGLCQLSNAIYDAALQAGCEIVERHGHSRTVPGSAAAAGRDATVAWNYVDLRLRPREAMRIEAQVTRDELVIRFRGHPGGERPPAARQQDAALPVAARSCATCGEVSCFRHEHHAATDAEGFGRTAFLVDENWSELQDYVLHARRPEDVLGIPLDGAKWRLGRYRWRRDGFARIGSAPLAALRRAVAIRCVPAQGQARRAAELIGAERIARRLARLLGPDVTRVCVAQSLLPFLWRAGELGGREVEVLMTRLPLAELHARLDRAIATHPERATLGDFRAPLALVEAEAAALAYATRIVTPHAEIARLFPGRAAVVEWKMPAARPRARVASPPRRIAFPGPTVSRKGAHELREAARALGLEVVTLGSELEGEGFWDGVAARRWDAAADPFGWIDEVAAVVQPALVEDRPRHLLAALASGVPVVATAACGIAARDGVTIVPAGDPVALIAALDAILPWHRAVKPA